MPPEVRRIADRYLRNPATIEIEHKSLAVPTVAQRYLNVSERQKLDVLSHVLETEAEPGEAVLIFARTKVGAAELAEKLQARGYAVEAMHGDMSQAGSVRRLRNGQVEIVVATDVPRAAWTWSGLASSSTTTSPTIWKPTSTGTGRAGAPQNRVLFMRAAMRNIQRRRQRIRR
jgi:ATP-dependent RNA helicase DeaD